MDNTTKQLSKEEMLAGGIPFELVTTMIAAQTNLEMAQKNMALTWQLIRRHFKNQPAAITEAHLSADGVSDVEVKNVLEAAKKADSIIEPADLLVPYSPISTVTLDVANKGYEDLMECFRQHLSSSLLEGGEGKITGNVGLREFDANIHEDFTNFQIALPSGIYRHISGGRIYVNVFLSSHDRRVRVLLIDVKKESGLEHGIKIAVLGSGPACLVDMRGKTVSTNCDSKLLKAVMDEAVKLTKERLGQVSSSIA